MNFFRTLSARMKMADPNHAAIVRGMVTVALFVFIGKIAGATKEMAVAYRYGLAAEVDAYQFLYTLVSWPIGVWTSVLTAVLVPLAVQMRDGRPGELPLFRAELLGLALFGGIALALLCWLGISRVLAVGNSGLPSNSVKLAIASLPGFIILLPLGMLTALQSAWMLAAGRHLNTLLECIPAIFVAGLVLGIPNGGIHPLVWGTVAGCAAHLAALVFLMGRRGEFETPAFRASSGQWRPFWQGFGIMAAGQALISLTVVIDQFYAVGLGTGAVATLGYANRILSLILSLAAVAVSRATLPVFSQMGRNGSNLRDVASHWARLMFAAGLVVTLVSYVLAPWAIKLLFERGRFSATDTAIVAEVLRYGLPQLPFYFAAMVLVSYALSQRRHRLIFWSGVIGFAGKVLGNLALVPLFGVGGIALAAIFVYGLNALFFWITLIATPPSDAVTPASRSHANMR